jgi:hypothetical protein
MKTLAQIKDELAKTMSCKDFNEFVEVQTSVNLRGHLNIISLCDQAAEIFAAQKHFTDIQVVEMMASFSLSDKRSLEETKHIYREEFKETVKDARWWVNKFGTVLSDGDTGGTRG